MEERVRQVNLPGARFPEGGYDIYLYSAENVRAFVSRVEAGYKESQVVNRAVGRRNLYKGFDTGNSEKVELVQLHLSREDLLILYSDGIRIDYGQCKYRGGSLREYCQLLSKSIFNVLTDRLDITALDDRSVLVHSKAGSMIYIISN